MHKPQPSPIVSPRTGLRIWYRSPLGRRLQRLEAAYLSDSIKVPYSFTLVQLGVLGWEKRYLDTGYLRRFHLIDEALSSPASPPTLIAHLDSLPLASESADVLILPHTLEFAADQHQLLREAERVLKPEGQMLILGFQPWSFYRIYRWLPGKYHPPPRSGRAIGHRRLLDWLNLLNFAGELSAWFDFHSLHSLPETGGWRDHFRSLWSVTYAVRAIKRSYTVIPLKPALESPLDWAPGVVEPTIQRKDNGMQS